MARNIPKSPFYNVRPIDEGLSYGVAVSGLEPMALSDDALRRDLFDLWIWEGVVVFEGLDDEDTQLELSSVFGQCILHPATDGSARGRPGLHDVHYDPAEGWLTRVDGELRGQWLPWHTDLIYADKINRGGILRSISLPSRLGQTGFNDKICAYSSLPEELKERIQGLHVSYRLELDLANQLFGKEHDVEVVRFSKLTAELQARKSEWPIVSHPLVITQAETGRKALNLSPWFALGITELPGKDGDALLHELVQYSIDPGNAYYHQWQPNEMVLWDNWRVLHSTPGCPADETRFLQRTTIEGDYGLGRVIDSAAANPARYISV